MDQNGKSTAEIDIALYDENRRRIPHEVLLRYAGQWVAVSGDGTRIVASANRIEELPDRLREAGAEPGTVVWERIPALLEDTWL